MTNGLNINYINMHQINVINLVHGGGDSGGGIAGKYVKDGLIFQLDCLYGVSINNDGKAIAWKDLITGLKLTGNPVSVAEDKALLFTGSGPSSFNELKVTDSNGKLVLTDACTLEIVLKKGISTLFDFSFKDDNYLEIMGSDDEDSYTLDYKGETEEGTIAYQEEETTTLQLSISSDTSSNDLEDNISISCTYCDGNLPIYAIRIYNRILSNAEKALNAAEDKSRFNSKQFTLDESLLDSNDWLL